MTKFKILKISSLLLFGGVVIGLLWRWFLPYSGDFQKNSIGSIQEVRVKEDVGYYWVDITFQWQDVQSLGDFQEIGLWNKDHWVARNADFRISQNGLVKYRFWLESNQLESILYLKIGDRIWPLKSESGLPHMKKAGTFRVKRHDAWRTWLGF